MANSMHISCIFDKYSLYSDLHVTVQWMSPQRQDQRSPIISFAITAKKVQVHVSTGANEL